ncbi:MAG: 3-deoxy-D-manno-octulosonate 8-phosphate phosphatase [Bacteroidales bacterium]|nr:3-deoxy-D-manno-octulosonate 8-phosphate phosphatase [Bacteroidales bacterium]MDD2424531.1 3-deoxy-D-manno-octulosonate 8-phosphate phosphatase [Bacteroidales bacterium]MDD3988487.1 3-deoxy-D-manno-octulosonate 8-phosphate phosphatase [Bacteroidales bacterium]
MSNYKSKLSGIKAFAFDVDGVFTDGSVLVTENGDLLRMHNAKDGFSVRMAVMMGYPVAIITGGVSSSIVSRFLQLGVDRKDIYTGSHVKLPDFMDFCNRHKLSPKEVLFMGDDIPDIPVLMECGLPSAPSDAVTGVREICDYISLYPGGKCCVRDIIEQTLRIQGKWNLSLVAYSG